jgi:hypothetical protein
MFGRGGKVVEDTTGLVEVAVVGESEVDEEVVAGEPVVLAARVGAVARPATKPPATTPPSTTTATMTVTSRRRARRLTLNTT